MSARPRVAVLGDGAPVGGLAPRFEIVDAGGEADVVLVVGRLPPELPDRREDAALVYLPDASAPDPRHAELVARADLVICTSMRARAALAGRAVARCAVLPGGAADVRLGEHLLAAWARKRRETTGLMAL